MKNKDRCYIAPPEVNHTNYAYIIGRKHGRDVASTVNESSTGTLTRAEAEREFEKFRKRKKESASYRKLMKDMNGNGARKKFWDGAREGFMKEVHDEEETEVHDDEESDDDGGEVYERSGRKVVQD